MKQRSQLLAALLVSLLTFPSGAKEKYANKVWIVVKPVQCLGNLWEKDWLARNNNDGAHYPRQKEPVLIKGFFARKDVAVEDIRVMPYMQGQQLCHTCDCPRGDTLYFLINAQDVPKMVQLGYTERMAAKDLPKNSKKK